MLFTGAAGLIYEYVLSTVNTYLQGNSIEQFSITIGVMFCMMGIGGFLQKLLTKALVELFILAELLLVLLGGFAPIVMQALFAAMPEDFPAVKIVYICIIGLLIGIEIPLVMRINERFTNSLGSNIAGTWAWDYIGGALGVVAWIWLLRSYVPITHISFFVAGCNLAVAIVALIFFWQRGLLGEKFGKFVCATTTLVVVAATVFGMINVDGWARILNQKLYEDPIITQLSTKYQEIVVTRGPHPSNPADHNYELYLNGNKQFSSVDEAIYHELLAHPAMTLAAARQRVLILGGGDGMALREVLKYKEVTDVTLVDLDPDMIKLASTDPVLRQLNQGSFDDARVHATLPSGIVDTGEQREVYMETGQAEKTVCNEVVASDGSRRSACDTTETTQSIGSVNVFTIDADQFVSAKSGPWDVVIVDLPDPNSVELAKLYSMEFYGKIKQVMSPDGIVVVQSTSPYHAKETFLCVLRTMAAAGLGVMPYHENVPSFGDWGWIIGSPSLRAETLYARASSIEAFAVDTKEVDQNVLKRALIFNKGALTATSNEISTVMRPTVFDYYTYEAWKVN